MRKAALYLLVSAVIVLLLILPAAALAASPGSGSGDGAAAAAMDHENYKPPEKPADDTSMAAIASTIFALPIGGWLVFRSLRKAKKNSK